MKFILGTKDGMTQVFDDKGMCFPATVLRVDPMTITAIKTAQENGYEAVQIASGEQKPQRLAKAELGHQGGAKKHVKEFRARATFGESVAGYATGQTIDASAFAPGDTVVVSAISKGKGFQGVVKRHGFHGGRGSHGQKHSHREPGSIGGGARAGGRVAKNMRMAGRMGGDRITVKNLTILQVNKDQNIILIKGAIPGRRGTLVEVRGAK
jgi:large subunit ribosomal protein L3